MNNNTVDDTLNSINKGNDSSSSSSHPPASSRFVMPLGLGGRFFLAFIVAIIGTWYGATQLRTAYIDEYLTWFWYNDLPSLSGVSRIYIYGGLLMTALLSPYSRPHLGDSPLQAPELFSFTLPKFFSLEGAMKLFASDTWINYTMIHLIRTITLTAFVACIVGIGGIIPPILVGIGMVLLHGIVQGCIGTSHRWYVPVYSCVALMFANGNANLSIDAWMYEKYESAYPFPPVCGADAETSASILCSGLARKMILMSGISTLFFGAITKFINGGIAWLDGASLSYYVSSEENGRSVWLKNMMSRHRWISLILSLGSIGLEAGSILAVFMPWTRPLIIVSAAGLHLGIWLTMWPNYFPQTLCYAVGMSWMTIIPNVEHYVYTFKPTESTLFASWISIGIWIFLTMVALLRIEYWPFTGIPMYSMYRDCSYSYRFLRDAVQAQSVAYEHAASGYPNALAWSNLWIILRLKNMDPAVIQERQQRKLQGSNSSVGANGYRPSADNNSLDSSEKEFVNLKTRVTSSRYTHDRHGVYLKQWRRTLHNIAALDMSKKPWGEIEQPYVSRYPAHEWLREMLPSLRQYARHNDWQLPSWVDKTGELQLRVKLRDRYAILASIPWNPNSDPTEENSDSQASAQTIRRRQ